MFKQTKSATRADHNNQATISRRRENARGGEIDVGMMLKKEINALLLASEAGLNERRFTVFVLRIDIGALVKEQREDLMKEFDLINRVPHKVVQC